MQRQCHPSHTCKEIYNNTGTYIVRFCLVSWFVDLMFTFLTHFSVCQSDICRQSYGHLKFTVYCVCSLCLARYRLLRLSHTATAILSCAEILWLIASCRLCGYAVLWL